MKLVAAPHLSRDINRRLYWEAKFKRLRIAPGDWRAMANRLAKTHDKDYGRPPRRRSERPAFLFHEIDRLVAEGKSVSAACRHLLGDKPRAVKALSKAHERRQKKVGH
jgi:hypothetical protein